MTKVVSSVGPRTGKCPSISTIAGSMPEYRKGIKLKSYIEQKNGTDDVKTSDNEND